MAIPLPKRPKVRTCTHIKATGQPCGSPALRGEFFCYFHTRVIKGVQHRVDMQLAPMALLEDCDSIQFSIMLVVDGLVKGTLDPLRARLILQGLRLAVRNARSVHFNTRFEDEKQTMVRKVPNYARQYLVEHPEYDPPLSDPVSQPCGADIPVREVETNVSSLAADAPVHEAAIKSAVQIEAQTEPQPSRRHDSHQTVQTGPDPAAKRRKNAARGASRGTEAQTNPAPKQRKKPSTSERHTTKQHKRIQRAQAAIPGALAGNWRDLKTVFDFAGISKQIKEAT